MLKAEEDIWDLLVAV